MSKFFSVIGGDRRNVELAKMLAGEGNQVFTFGLDNIKKDELNISNIELCNNLEDAIENSDIVIGPIPFSRDGQFLNFPLSEQKIELSELASWLDNKAFFAGNITDNFYEIAKETKVIITDFMKIEELAILNNIATAEGAISKIIENTDINIQESNILILGFGKIGKILSKKLEALGANITCSARKEQDLAWIEAYGYKKLNTYSLQNLNEYDIIINTVPHIIFDKELLEKVNKDALLLELASKPGGFDLDFIKNMKLNYVIAPGLPGKIAPKASAQYIKKIINKL